MGRVSSHLIWAGTLISVSSCTRSLQALNHSRPLSPDEIPSCQHVNTENEGWYVRNELLQKVTCNGRHAVCEKVGDSSAWTSVIRSNIRLVRFESCAEQAPPACVSPGTKSEGWQASNWFQWDSCANLAIICQGIGTRTEGWYSFEKHSPLPIANKHCR
jgi:hypothetical protein